MMQKDWPFEWADGQPRFRKLPVITQEITIALTMYTVVALKDAADLLDDPEFARRFTQEDRAPYGLELWPSAIMLAEYIIKMGDGAGRSAIEVGCGLGLVSMIASKMNWKMLATDREEASLKFAAYNAAQNDVRIDEFDTLNWHEPNLKRQFPWVFAADVLYQKEDHEPILICLKMLMALDGVALISDPNRGIADRFISKAESFGFDVEVIPTQCVTPELETKKGRIFKLRRTSG